MSLTANVHELGSHRNVYIHPLAIASICDHHTRVTCSGTRLAANAAVLGLLFGIIDKHNSNIAICDAVDVIYDVDSFGNVHFVESEVESKNRLLTTVYPQYVLLGWYAVNVEMIPAYQRIHQLLNSHHQIPYFMLLNPVALLSDDIPISLYVTNTSTSFELISYQLGTTPSENISIEHIMKHVRSQSVNSTQQLNQGMITSIAILQSHIDKVIQYLLLVEAQKIPVDYELLRAINQVLLNLPSESQSLVANSLQQSSIAQHSILSQADETLTEELLSLYLSSATKATNDLSQLIEVTNVCAITEKKW